MGRGGRGGSKVWVSWQMLGMGDVGYWGHKKGLIFAWPSQQVLGSVTCAKYLRG